MYPNDLRLAHRTRRQFLGNTGIGLGAMAMASLTGGATVRGASPSTSENPLAPKSSPLPAKAKRVIYLHMSGAPPQHDMFDYKSKLVELNGQPCPQSFLEGQRFAFIKGVPKLLGTPHQFKKCGQSGQEISEVLPHLSEVADDLCIVKSMTTDQFNHAPAELLLFTGSPRFGGASMGSWITYGLGSESEDLPGFVVLVSGGTDPTGGKSLWGSGFLPSVFQGVQCRSAGEPILFVNNPTGMSREVRRQSLDTLKELNEQELARVGDPETQSRISQYELAFRMQMAVPDVANLAGEPEHIHAMYGTEPGRASFANNCLLARRMLERGVRFVQLFDWGWDFHGTGAGEDIKLGLPGKCATVDKPIAALLKDLKQRGLLEDTLVVWGGEFGRTAMNEERNGSKFLGRDHHPHAYTIWLAGAGIKAGQTYGATDEIGYFVTDGKMDPHDLQATILHLLGLDPFQLKYPYQGLNQRLIGPANTPKIQQGLLA
jgi:hypothetical protein